MFDFLISAITSFFITIGILSPTVRTTLPPVPVVVDEATSTPEIKFISGNALDVAAQEAERQAQLEQERLAKELQREADLREARLLREAAIARERQQSSNLSITDSSDTNFNSQRVIGSTKSVTQVNQSVSQSNTEVSATATKYNSLINQYEPLLNAWVGIVEGDTVATLADVANERIIRIRSIDFFLEGSDYQPPQTYSTIKNFYQNIYQDMSTVADSYNYAKKEITSLSNYVASIGGFTAPTISQDITLQNKLSLFINDARLNNPTTVAATITRVANEIAQYDAGYVLTLNEIDDGLAAAADARDAANGVDRTIPCWQIQLDYREAWADINKKYARQGIFYSSARDQEVANLTTQYKTDYAACF